MKRPIKPFVVEVRKGQKRPGTPEFMPKPEKPSEDDAMRRAEAMLFAPQAAPATDDGLAGSRTGRILESIADPAPEPAILDDLEPTMRRRGRPPGSKNKQKPAPVASMPAKRRGRPPRNPEGSVRQVAVTPELTNAALEAIARVQPAPTLAMPARSTGPAPRFEPPVKRQRGRPRKVAVAAAAGVLPHSAEDPAQAIAPAYASRLSGHIGNLPFVLRAALEAGAGQQEAIPAALMRMRAGERWKRRLRGAALRAFERKNQRQA